ncbi:hypothetical protein KOI35_03320 [Actinoplanes bogorensis]|uniref:Uncharacterized protein n=1 Tax=Paractinoplanes bogorensis TaxID=1610840 RepID=A0ABS5YGF5_9ACTN|nr:hypothetical protein [Actinoplanes bogorensis]MBU2662532.1 hypothetical protein [Actinoplanes bogorensis]
MKLIVAGITPVAVAVLAYVLNRALKRAENRQWFSQKLVEKRIALLSEALPDLNDLYCYFAWVGRWKELSPPEILLRKRRLDQLFHANSPFFSPDARNAYESFVDALFETFVQPGKSARLRTGLSSQHGNRMMTFSEGWEPGWNDMFAAEDKRTAPDVVKDRYQDLTTVLGSEVGA